MIIETQSIETQLARIAQITLKNKTPEAVELKKKLIQLEEEIDDTLQTLEEETK